MRTFDCPESQLRLNECGEGEYVSRESFEILLAELLRCKSVFVEEQLYTLAKRVDNAIQEATQT